MTKSYKEIKECVHKRVRKTVMTNILRNVMKRKPRFWGLKKKRNWESKTVYLAVYKYMYAVGYNALLKEIKKWYDVGPITLSTNIKRALKVTKEWSISNIKRGNASSWTIAARNTYFPKCIQDTVLWMDSSDFRLIGKNKASTKHSDWSYKENSPAQRFMFIQNAQGKFLEVDGGYSPKIDDGSYLTLQKSILSKYYKGEYLLQIVVLNLVSRFLV